MNLASLSIRRPVFVSCLFLLILALGALSYVRLRTELYPSVSFPVVNVIVPFPGAGPEEVENQVSRPLENALGGIAGIRTLRSRNLQGAGVVTAVFALNSDVRAAEQKVIQTVARVRGDFPTGTLEPTIRTIDPSDVPLLTVSLTADLPPEKLFDLADREIRPLFEQISQVGWVELLGGRKREIQVEVDRKKLAAREMTMGEVVQRVGMGGMNIPAGQISGERDTLVRWVGQYGSLEALRRTPIRFVGNEAVTTLDEVATVREGLSDEKNRVYVAGSRALMLNVYRQSGGDTLRIAQSLREKVAELNAQHPQARLAIVHDGTLPIRDGVKEATLAIVIGIFLTIGVVYLFLSSWRSTIITGLALPNSLLGAFLLMEWAGFSINITTLAALSLAVGLLIDDAIVVRESIFRRIEGGEAPEEAAVRGTQDVALAVIATTLTVLSVFGPIAFLQGIIGQFFKEFGLTICFAMLISLLDSLTIAPMLSAHFAGKKGESQAKGALLERFDRFQVWLERTYLRVLEVTLRHPLRVLGASFLVFALSFVAFSTIPKSFVPPTGSGEFQVVMDAPPGTSLESMDRLARSVDESVRRHPEVRRTLLTVGGQNGEGYQAQILVQLKGDMERSASTQEMKERVRQDIRSFERLNASVQDIVDIGGGAGQPYVVHVKGQDLEQVRQVSEALMTRLRQGRGLKDVDSSYRAGASELRLKLDPRRAEELGVSATEVGQELRLLLAGISPAKYPSGGELYDIRVRLREEQRDFVRDYGEILVPNLNHRLVPLSSLAPRELASSPSDIRRADRKRFIEVTADVDPEGPGLAHAIEETRRLFASGEISLPPGVTYEFAGQTKDFQDLLGSVVLAVVLSIGFMYLVLASLYESFFVPLAILLVLPLAVCGAFYALAVTRAPLEINSMIGCILLLGVAAKNSILLVDHLHEAMLRGQSLQESILEAGRARLRPILMTSFALIAGMLPVAISWEEAARQRAGMAIAVMGGVISSTLLSLVVVPAAYPYLVRFQAWTLRRLGWEAQTRTHR